MSNTITIWRRYDSNTTPRGFGNPPTYHIDKPYTSDTDMIWADPIEITLPDGYSVAEAADGQQYLYDARGRQEPILDDHGHPAIVIGVGVNKQGKTFSRCLRLDK